LLLLFVAFSVEPDNGEDGEEDDIKPERSEEITAGESDNPVEFENERTEPIKLLNSDVSSRCVALSDRLSEDKRSLNPFSTELTVP
jgi:hypothetical protein